MGRDLLKINVIAAFSALFMFRSDSKVIAKIAYCTRGVGRKGLMDKLNSHLQVRCSKHAVLYVYLYLMFGSFTEILWLWLSIQLSG